MKRKKHNHLIGYLSVIFLVLLLIVLGIRIFLKKSSENKNSVSDYALAKVGDIITMGTYEQDNISNGKESLNWQILDIKDGKALIISCPVLDCKEFSETADIAGWSESSLRKWLNTDFYESAFSDSEKSIITLTEINNPGTYVGYDDSGCWTVSNTVSNLETILSEADGQDNTQDRIFLLSIDEANKFFASDNDRKAFLSDYGTEIFIKLGFEQAQNGNIDEDTIRGYYEQETSKYGRGFCNWWLRSPGIIEDAAAAVDYNGSAGQSMAVNAKDGGVRPAMWIEIQ